MEFSFFVDAGTCHIKIVAVDVKKKEKLICE